MSFLPSSAPPDPVCRPAAPCAPGDSVYAALDLGTNNCRMLVARPTLDGFRVIDSFSRITRLGEGLARTGVLSEAAMVRTIDALAACADKMARNRVTRARLVATEACRQARNCAEFVARAAQATGLALDIIPAEEEAGLALAGCASLLDNRLPRALVFDIGGGSTELLWISNGPHGQRVDGVESLPLGVVTLSEQRGADIHHPDRYDQVVDDIARRLAPFEARHGISDGIGAGLVQMLGTSGTVTTLGALHLDLDRYDRSRVDGLALDIADINAITRRLVAMSAAQRAAHPCIGTERADLVLAGCAILQAICRQWPLTRLRVADRGVREGILLGMMRDDGILGATQQ